ncbi:hypothetical protein MHYP_G00210090 [Metynnis hypsauchen]
MRSERHHGREPPVKMGEIFLHVMYRSTKMSTGCEELVFGIVPALLMPEPGAVRIMAGLRATGIIDHICLLAMEKPSYVPAFR